MTSLSLRADCAHCAALCCVALAFDRSDQFAFHKPAGEPCRNLTACGACRIHGSRASQGFPGCMTYDCQGAGQRVTQGLFGGRSWLDDVELLQPMADAFLTVTRAHRALALLHQAGKLALSPAEHAERGRVGAALEAAAADAEQVARLEAQTWSFLRGLRSEVVRELMASVSHLPHPAPRRTLRPPTLSSDQPPPRSESQSGPLRRSGKRGPAGARAASDG